MRKSLNRIASAATTVAMVGSMLLTAGPVGAAAPSTMKDTLSREKISVSATHTLAATGVPTWGNGESLVFNYGTSGFTLVAGAIGTCTITGTCTAEVSATNTVVVTCTATNGCSGTLGLGTDSFSGTNPGTTGSKEITLISNAGSGVSGSFAIPIVDDDQVTVTATVAPSITFDIDTQSADNSLPNITETAAPYSVALGTISTSNGKVSGTVDGVNFIMLDLDTNASGGAVVTVKSLNGSSGLVSTSVPGDTIPSATAAMSNGTANYGICVLSTAGTSTASGTFTAVSPFASTCAGNSETNSVGGLTTGAQEILTTGGNPVATGRAQIAVNGAISVVTNAHNDYTDTLTFIATGTF